ncbi:hypothetical protein [Paractinoplanes durhamensis]|uniref:Uncharacterized protein n=1 Tax=Paractinoplanes durhamensis TaxID=113563 RepID=A0ABQ3Z3F5_9ACTN|nr:hypothetical protein [Actinoplanes durhamensis]GIE04357.1 hypothetical protein Adu01nite_57070 [Actinoplanes durhamensis]
MTEPRMSFDNLNFQGGIQNFGGQNTNTQQNNYFQLSPREQVDAQIAALRAAIGEEPDIAVVEQGLAQPTPANREQIDRALERLSTNAGNASKAAEAIAAIGALIAAHWPF